MSANFKIIIVGGGIAGLSAAIALRKDDREILVLEQSSLIREIGATISLQPNASKIIESVWDLAGDLKKRGSMVDEGFQVYALDGKMQIRIPLSTMEKYGGERMLYHRMDLHDVLKQRATAQGHPGNPAELRASSRVARVDCDGGVVELESGEVLKADLVVGADGIKSVVRDAVVGKHVEALPTGFSAYRIMISVEELSQQRAFSQIIDPRKPYTTMVLGPDRRMIMGPARNGSVYSIVAMVPDEQMVESSSNSSWVTRGDLNKLLETFADFPDWAKEPLQLAKETGLWQLRDIDPLPTWYKGRTILIGDAAHAMLPTQGQGASQAVEDAEALGAFFTDLEDSTLPAVRSINSTIFECRRDRATTIQLYSRQMARPATDEAGLTIKMNPSEFMDYNCSYTGARDWYLRQHSQSPSLMSA
ncbi:uncharacterized protein Z519_10307 [Cladophialophora bantiana CBS 173.52]|uniref:FAD-binding domain-containing protein n=1 Tax=Cladophialophora bantiana (strain ATCC 10958 / CBS 173.52 / CDC B-1940 / NIH 8579) TaxID=1442370 RepID=A0A0D2H671_CLAB1|nr:uncharacterized protein Z519_10307 [Cladophialophora bantiana CBS 173.52]KIW88823.1 hypothetical protein Z519_10307 [Cladophialophora bantiana CBS 173.52]